MRTEGSIDDILFNLASSIQGWDDPSSSKETRVALAAYIRRIEANQESVHSTLRILADDMRAFSGEMSMEPNISDRGREKAHALWHSSGVLQSVIARLIK